MTREKAFSLAGWVIAGLLSLLLAFSAFGKLTKQAQVVEGLHEKMGYPESVIQPLGVVELACVVLFLIPRTTTLGAVLLTGYFGGAIATHVRVEEPYVLQFLFGVLGWVSVYLRDARIRSLLPMTEPPGGVMEVDP